MNNKEIGIFGQIQIYLISLITLAGLIFIL